METTLNEQKKEEIPPKSKKFQTSSVFVRTSFIIGIITVALSIAYMGTSGFLLHFGALPLNIICSFTLALALSGVILGSISLRTNRNIYAIIGIVINIVIIGVQILFLVVGNNVA